jgi:thiol-disulfide isomerase/thioredoxin
MKSLKVIFPIILFLTCLLLSCTPKPASSCKISGLASNFAPRELYVTIDGQRDTIKLKDDGTFSGEFNIAKPVDATFQGDRLFLYLYLEPGKTIGINFDAKAFDSLLVFSGDLALPNKYLHEKTIAGNDLYKRINQFYVSPFKPSDFLWVRDSISKAEFAFLEKFMKNNPGLNAAFVTREKKVLEFSVYYDLYNYPRMAEYYNKTLPELPADWYAFLDKINLDDPSLLDISDIRAFISGYVQQESMKKANIPAIKSWGNPELLKAMFVFTTEHFKSPEIFGVILFDKLKQHIDSEGTFGIESLVAQYLSTSVNEKYKTIIKEMSDKWTALAPGQPAPEFTLLDIDGKNVSLSDFRGKYVFIDFWATWCGPCRAEIPAYTKLVADYKKRNIVFISMSVDKEKPKWEEMVKMDKFPWIQIHDPIKVNKKYLVMYIPTFTFIDPQGEIINARCPRPSNPELRKIFDSQSGL